MKSGDKAVNMKHVKIIGQQNGEAFLLGIMLQSYAGIRRFQI